MVNRFNPMISESQKPEDRVVTILLALAFIINCWRLYTQCSLRWFLVKTEKSKLFNYIGTYNIYAVFQLKRLCTYTAVPSSSDWIISNNGKTKFLIILVTCSSYVQLFVHRDKDGFWRAAAAGYTDVRHGLVHTCIQVLIL